MASRPESSNCERRHIEEIISMSSSDVGQVTPNRQVEEEEEEEVVGLNDHEHYYDLERRITRLESGSIFGFAAAMALTLLYLLRR